MKQKQSTISANMGSILLTQQRYSKTVTIYDPLHSTEEDRFVDISYARSQKLLVVVYAERGDTIRIISSRPATNNERKQYESSA